MMPSSRKGRRKKRIERKPVSITPGLAAKLRKAARGRSPTDPLLLQSNGEPWTAGARRRPIEDAVARAGLKGVTLYSLRHGSIIRQLLAGVPMRVVAVNHDTSVAMLERSYSAFISDVSDVVTRRALIDTSQPPTARQGRPVAARRAVAPCAARVQEKPFPDLPAWVPDQWVPFNDAVEQIKRGGSVRLAARDLQRDLRHKRMTAAVRHMRRDGTLNYTVGPAFWQNFDIVPRLSGGVSVRGKTEDTPAGKVVHRLLGGGSFYFFVSGGDLQKLYPEAAGAVAPEPAEPSAEKPQRRRGRKPKHDWPGIVIEIARRCHRNGIPDNERAFARDILAWCQDQFADEPSESDVRAMVKRVCDALKI